MTNVFIDRRGTIYIYRTQACWAAERIQKLMSNLDGRNTLCLRAIVDLCLERERETRRKRLLLRIPELF